MRSPLLCFPAHQPLEIYRPCWEALLYSSSSLLCMIPGNSAKANACRVRGTGAVSAGMFADAREGLDPPWVHAQEAIRISFGDPPVEYGLPELLPQRFGPADLLGDSGAPLLLQPQHNRVAFAAGSAAFALEHSATAAAAQQQGEACPPLPAVPTRNGVALTNGRRAAPEAAQRPAQPRKNGGAGVSSLLEAAAKRALRAANEV